MTCVRHYCPTLFASNFRFPTAKLSYLFQIQRFKATLWLGEEFPIKLQEQVLPILDLMSTMASPHVSKLKDFITMQLPSGFPIKIEIPLFNFLNACVTFGNVFALETPVENVTNIQENDRLSCVIDDRCFDIPAHYTNKGGDYRRQLTFEDEDDLLQYAIQQSLIESGSESEQVDIWEALKAHRPVTPNHYTDDDAQMQRYAACHFRFNTHHTNRLHPNASSYAYILLDEIVLPFRLKKLQPNQI